MGDKRGGKYLAVGERVHNDGGDDGKNFRDFFWKLAVNAIEKCSLINVLTLQIIYTKKLF